MPVYKIHDKKRKQDCHYGIEFSDGNKNNLGVANHKLKKQQLHKCQKQVLDAWSDALGNDEIHHIPLEFGDQTEPRDSASIVIFNHDSNIC